MRRKSIYRRNQRGVALLFALGVLSLLLVMGLAFVANSLLAQKVAYNNSSRSQAKMLAQSAISRMAMSVMYYQLSANKLNQIPVNYMDVCSRYDLKTGVESEPNHDDDAATDGLRNNDSKLIPGTSLSTSYDMKKDENQRAEWSYITAKTGDTADDEKLVGRIAYQQIPMTTTAQINLDHNLRGVYPKETPVRAPWNVRKGEDINELNLNKTYVLKNWQTEAPNENDMHASTFDAFFQAYAGSIFSTDKDVKEAWLRRWFIDGTVAADPEYYRYDETSGTGTGTGTGTDPKITYYHRFNLGKLDDKEATSADEWYQRLGIANNDDASKNSQTAVDKLARDSVEFKITDSGTPSEGVGLPFLKFIGSFRGTFESIEYRRRQIAANLNDYCDGDSIPTSNVSASSSETTNWGTVYNQEMANWPKYTGNEKTPYINELAFGFKVDPSLKKGTGSYASFNVNVNLKVSRAELIAELIQIYKDLINKDGVENKNDYELRAHLKSLNLKFKVTAKGTLTYTKSDGSSATAPLDETNFEEEVKYDAQNVILPFNTDNPIWNKGYLVYAKELDAPSSSSSPKDDGIDFDFSTKFPAVAGTVTNATLDEVKIEVTSAKFKLGGIVLMDTHDAKPFGVDFVRWEDDSTDGLPEASSASPLTLFSNASVPGQVTSGSGWITGSSLGSIPDGYHYFYLGGMEAKDPRQNLNAKYTASVTKEKTDWSLPDSIKLVDFDNAYPAEVMSIKMADNPEAVTGDKVADRLVAGKCNHDANPNRTGDSDADECDAEFPTLTAGDPNLDPAWRGDGEDEHLSTAYIRNAPMRSPWELGVIHRAMAWQTLNLKSAMRPVPIESDATEAAASTEPIRNEDMRQPGDSWNGDGTSFAGGDGGILEQIKMTDNAYCYGKLNVNMLSDNTALNPDYTEKDDEMARSLFFNLRRGQSVGDLFVDESGSYPETGTLITWDATSAVADPMKKAVDEFRKNYGEDYKNAFENRAQFLAWKDSSGKCLANGFGIISDAEYEKLPDAQREEIVGKTINLIKGTNSTSNMIRFVVVAQTIRDMGGGTEIVRIKYNGKVETKECKYRVFDVKEDDSEFPDDFPKNDKYLYFDEITGEVKLLVTMENNPTTGQIIVRQIEYLE